MTPSYSPKRGEAYLVGAQVSGSLLPCPSIVSVAGTFLSQRYLRGWDILVPAPSPWLGHSCPSKDRRRGRFALPKRVRRHSCRRGFYRRCGDAKKGVAPVVFVGGDADATVWVLSGGTLKYRETSFSPTGGYSIAR